VEVVQSEFPDIDVETYFVNFEGIWELKEEGSRERSAAAKSRRMLSLPDVRRERMGHGLTSDGTVWYTILAFSGSRRHCPGLGYPVSRMLQKRFVEASKAAMLVATDSK
jgi:hypothetical protein